MLHLFLSNRMIRRNSQMYTYLKLQSLVCAQWQCSKKALITVANYEPSKLNKIIRRGTELFQSFHMGQNL